MKTSLAVRLEELIKKTDDSKFFQIYKDFLDFKRIHFIEFNLINRISLMNDIVEIIESEMELRNGIEKLAIQRMNQENQMKKKETVESDVDEWKNKWIEENEPPKETSMKSDFKKIITYVVCAHIFVLSAIFIYNKLQKTEEEPVLQDYTKNYTYQYPPNPDYNKTLK